MKILLGSDLHLEFKGQQELPELPEYDVAILAGDIGNGTAGIEWALETFGNSKPLIYVPGNHEYYGKDFHIVNQQLQEYADTYKDDIHCLNPGSITIDGVSFVGATLWTDFKLNGYQNYTSDSWKRALSDFQIIRKGDNTFTPYDSCDLNYQHTNYIVDTLKQGAEKNVVITHFLPSQEAISSFWRGNNLNPYFCNDMDDVISHYKPDLWLYGHTHDKGDIIHSSGKTRLVANPRGYPKEKKDNFKWKILEI